MHKEITPFFIRTISSLHAGSGDDNGLVDLPIQRELVTGYPKIEASTLKGAIRSRVEQLDADHTKIHLAFGYDDKSSYKEDASFLGNGDADNYAQQFMGALAFTDARLLLFPVRSMKGTFALVTCPYVLRRFAEDLQISSHEKANSIIGFLNNLPNDLGDTKDHAGYCLSSGTNLELNGHVILEEYCFEVKKENTIPNFTLINDLKLFLGQKITDKLVIVDDDVFSDFTQLFTERMTRNKIDDSTGTVDAKTGGLFTEEYLPPEAVLYSLAMANKPFQPETKKDKEGKVIVKHKELPNDFSSCKNVMDFITKDAWTGGNTKKVLQIGGNTTVGKGIVELTFAS